MRLETSVRDEIHNELEELSKMEVGTEQYKTTVDGVTKLIDRVIEMEKLDIESDDRIKTREIERELKLQQMDDDRKDSIAKNVIALVTFVGGCGLTVWGSLKSWKFEETGTITNGPGRKFTSNLFNYFKK